MSAPPGRGVSEDAWPHAPPPLQRGQAPTGGHQAALPHPPPGPMPSSPGGWERRNPRREPGERTGFPVVAAAGWGGGRLGRGRPDTAAAGRPGERAGRVPGREAQQPGPTPAAVSTRMRLFWGRKRGAPASSHAACGNSPAPTPMPRTSTATRPEQADPVRSRKLSRVGPG